MNARIFTRLKFGRSLLSLLALTGLMSCAMKQPPLQTVPYVDIKRYMGDWYVISHLPNSLEKGKVGTLDRYLWRSDGKIDNHFLFRKGSLDAPLQQWKGLAEVQNITTYAEWRVQFIPPVSSPYLIIDLDPGYQWSVVGYPTRKLGWVLSRNPTMDERTYQGILQRLAKQGYDIRKFEKVPQVK